MISRCASVVARKQPLVGVASILLNIWWIYYNDMILRGINHVRNCLSAAEVALDAVNAFLWCKKVYKESDMHCLACDKYPT